VAGRIKETKSVKQIFDETLTEFGEVTGRLAALSAH
ncbi:MAG: nitronate monooxygenase, partial [Paraglaciecola chathamensis]